MADTPALAPHEWAAVIEALEALADAASWGADYAESAQAMRDHSRLSEIILGIERGQPFGFTWEDVDSIRECARAMREEWGDKLHGGAVVADRAESAAARLAALLPPREEPENP